MLKLNTEFRSNLTYLDAKENFTSSYSPEIHATFRPAPALAEGEIHVWTLWPGSQTVSEYIPLLSRSESERAFALRTTQLFNRFVADHGSLRLLLSAYLETDPRKLSFVTNQYGKPHLENNSYRLRFNMSHSGEITMIAVCLDAEIGIDVEAVRSIPEWADIAVSQFSVGENQSIHAEMPAHRIEAFFRCWTRKEAVIKAIGMGLSVPLDSFTVSTSLRQPPALLQCSWGEDARSRWSLMHLEPAIGYVGAVAVENAGWSTLHFAWP